MYLKYDSSTVYITVKIYIYILYDFEGILLYNKSSKLQ